MQVFLGLGSNVGDREGYLRKAVAAIGKLERSWVRRASSIYETEPWGKRDQDPFLNQVVEVDTKLGPQELLVACQRIEKDLGRDNRERWGPRTIDIDILIYSDVVIDDENLRVPHRLLSERRFVLVPLTELSPTVSVPGLGKTVREVLESCSDRGRVELYESRG